MVHIINKQYKFDSLKGKVIYHYCNPDSFLKIIENKCIWLSANNNMNDYTERGEWFSKAFHKVLDRKKNDFGDISYQKIIDIIKTINKIKYISCFSKSKDSLSQWRAYAQNGEGVAIGFRFDETEIKIIDHFPKPPTLLDELNIYLSKIEYINLDKLEMIINNSLPLCMDDNIINEELFMYLIQIYNIIKNPAFKEEEEVRLIYSPNIDKLYKITNPLPGKNNSELKYRIASDFLTSYFEYSIKNDIFNEVVLGPKNKFTDEDIATFLGLHGLGDVKITRSSATYR